MVARPFANPSRDRRRTAETGFRQPRQRDRETERQREAEAEIERLLGDGIVGFDEERRLTGSETAEQPSIGR